MHCLAPVINLAQRTGKCSLVTRCLCVMSSGYSSESLNLLWAVQTPGKAQLQYFSHFQCKSWIPVCLWQTVGACLIVFTSYERSTQITEVLPNPRTFYWSLLSFHFRNKNICELKKNICIPFTTPPPPRDDLWNWELEEFFVKCSDNYPPSWMVSRVSRGSRGKLGLSQSNQDICLICLFEKL